MCTIGEKVICVNDTFDPSLAARGGKGPVKGQIYTVRDVVDSGISPQTGHRAPGYRLEEVVLASGRSGLEPCFSDWHFDPADGEAWVGDDASAGWWDGLRQSIRDADFLAWLGRYEGVWQAGGMTVEIRRRSDGWLEARSLESFLERPLGRVLEEAVLLGRPDGPLGLRPVILSYPLMSVWLSPCEMHRLRGAVHVHQGRKMILNLIERRIAEMPAGQRARRWNAYWQFNEDRQVTSHRDLLAHRRLLDLFCRECGYRSPAQFADKGYSSPVPRVGEPNNSN